MTAPIERDIRVHAEVAAHPYRLVFATVSGAHLYGFASPDSDVDLRGVHVLPPRELLGLELGPATIEVSHVRDALEVDLVTHDIGKFCDLLLRRNGYVLEQLMSPLIVSTGPEHVELKEMVPHLVTRHHAHHYLGFAANQWRLFQKPQIPRVKPLLYVYRVLLTGLHLMRTGEIEANLIRLNDEFKLAYVPELIAQKVEGSEKTPLAPGDVSIHEREYKRIVAELEQARDTTFLAEVPAARSALHDLLVRIRLGAGAYTRRESANESCWVGE
jgi:predicted nucleotidyltransferase